MDLYTIHQQHTTTDVCQVRLDLWAELTPFPPPEGRPSRKRSALFEGFGIWAIIELTSNTLEKKYVGTFKIFKMPIGWEQKTNH